MSTEATTSRRQATRERLLDAAAQVFAETGLDAASVEAVCERAGFTRGAFYSNFDSKEQLFLELSTRTASQQIAAVRARVARFDTDGAPGDPADLVRQVLEAAGNDRQGVLLLSEIRLRALRAPELAAQFRAQEDQLIAEVAQIVGDVAANRGLEPRLEPDRAARLLLATWAWGAERAMLDGEDEPYRDRALGSLLTEVAELLLGPLA
jgi:AcrR family transcriptional regulator